MRWHRWRNRVLSNPSFQRWAARNPLTRAIGHRKAIALHHLTAGFVYSQTLAALVELELLGVLAEGPISRLGLVAGRVVWRGISLLNPAETRVR